MESTGSNTSSLQGGESSSTSTGTSNGSTSISNLNTTQVPSSMVAQIQQQVDPTQPKSLTSNGLWVGVLVTGITLFVIAGVAAVAGIIMHWRKSTTS